MKDIPVYKSRYRGVIVLLTVVGMLCHLITGCQFKETPPADAITVLQAMLMASKNVPAGQYKYSNAPDGSKAALSPDLLAGLYGEASRQWLNVDEKSIIDSAAIYLSEQRHPFELAVFRCENEGDISGGIGSVLGICRSRLSWAKQVWQGSEYEQLLSHATVVSEKQFVLLIIAEDPSPMIAAAGRVIRKGSAG